MLWRTALNVQCSAFRWSSGVLVSAWRGTQRLLAIALVVILSGCFDQRHDDGVRFCDKLGRLAEDIRINGQNSNLVIDSLIVGSTVQCSEKGGICFTQGKKSLTESGQISSTLNHDRWSAILTNSLNPASTTLRLKSLDFGDRLYVTCK